MAVGKLTHIYPSTIKFTTSTFKLEDDIIKIQLVGLQETDCVCVETVVGTGDCDEKYIPYSPDCCGQLCYGYPQGQFFLNVPGRYRLVLSNRLNNHLTDPAWFENVEIFQTPVDGKNINLDQGDCGMACAQKIECDPLGIKIDGVLCAYPATDAAAVATAIAANPTSIRLIAAGIGADPIATRSIATGIADDATSMTLISNGVTITAAKLCAALAGVQNTTTFVGG